MARQRLSERTKGAQPDGPFEGVPAHLQHGLIHWFTDIAESGTGGYFGHERQLREIAAFLRARVNPGANAARLAEALIATAVQNEEFFLDLIDATLEIFAVGTSRTAALRRLLDLSGSVWSVDEATKSLTRAVTDEAQATYELAISVADEITAQIREAWSHAFGRNGDPSDAWDHAIKAMEALFIPLVIPKKDKANLGGVVGELRNQGHVWEMVLPGKDDDNDVTPLVGMLNGIWPNTDRHPGGTNDRPPTPEEARAVVTLAATIVQWHREGWVLRRR